MASWSLTAEFLALILTGIMFLYLRNSRAGTRTRRRSLFLWALRLAAAAVVLNAACTELIELGLAVPYPLTMGLNTLYFLMTVWQASFIALYVFDLLLEHVYDRRRAKRAALSVAALNVAFAGLLAANAFTGLVFSIDPSGAYVRGPLNLAGYLVLGIELALVIVCYVRHRASEGAHVRRVMWTLPPVVIALTLFQLAYPDLYLNGTIAAFAMLVLLLNFQSARLDTDGLTYLGDRKSFNSALVQLAAESTPFQILSVTLQDFAFVNRRFGHGRADEVLYHAGTWLSAFDPKGRAFRYGKVSFAIVRSDGGREEADRALEALAERFDGTWPAGEHACKLDACCCSLVRERQAWDAERIIDYLDAMNALAKRERLRTVRFDDGLERAVDRRHYLVEVLNDGIEHRRFYMHYQPILSCGPRRFERAEALLRLDDREGRPVSTGDLISLAEETGRIDEVSWIMLEEVCRFLGANPGLPLDAVTVNLSMPQLLDPQLDERIVELLRLHSVQPKRMKIEITERVLAESAQSVEDAMQRLARAGIGCLLDDFGTGYANFSLVMRLPFECVKLDRTLLVDIDRDRRDRNVVRRLVELFHDLDIQVVAEGIETGAQASVLEGLGADSIQGYWFSRPLPEDEVTAFLATVA